MITLSKIAKLAHVSVSTVSKAFSGSNEVNEETREMIFDIAKKYGCFKKFYNAKYPKFVIAILCPEFNSLYYTRYLSLIQNKLEKENCEMCVAATGFSAESEKNLIEYYYKYANVDGIIVIGSRTRVADPCEIPIVYINSQYEQSDRNLVWSNMQKVLCDSIRYLKENRVDSIGFLGEGLTSKKLELFKQALLENDICPNEDYISITSERFEKGGYSAMENLFMKEQIPRAIICAYDYMAIGAIRCIYDHGLHVPKDIAVLGMDDIPEAIYLNPPLASISTDTEEICRIVVETIIKQINGECIEYNREIGSKFCLRESFKII